MCGDIISPPQYTLIANILYVGKDHHVEHLPSKVADKFHMHTSTWTEGLPKTLFILFLAPTDRKIKQITKSQKHGNN